MSLKRINLNLGEYIKVFKSVDCNGETCWKTGLMKFDKDKYYPYCNPYNEKGKQDCLRMAENMKKEKTWREHPKYYKIKDNIKKITNEQVKSIREELLDKHETVSTKATDKEIKEIIAINDYFLNNLESLSVNRSTKLIRILGVYTQRMWSRN